MSRSPLSRQNKLARHGFREGYPLWNPEPVSLPEDRQEKGLEIGDVGVIDEDGIFNFIFNVYQFPDAALAGHTVTGQPNIYEYETFDAGHLFSSPSTDWHISVERDAPYHTDPYTTNHE